MLQRVCTQEDQSGLKWRLEFRALARPSEVFMAWIRIVEPEGAAPALRDAYAVVAGRRGQVDNILRVHSLNPAVMISHLRLYADLMFGPSELTRAEREMLALAVSATNGCHY